MLGFQALISHQSRGELNMIQNENLKKNVRKNCDNILGFGCLNFLGDASFDWSVKPAMWR